MEKKILVDIHPRSYEHPMDRAATGMLKDLPGLKEAAQFLGQFISDNSIRLFFMSNSIRVSGTQFPEVYNMVHEACKILDLDIEPETFITNNPAHNAMTIGFGKPFLVLHSSLLRSLDQDDLFTIIGHELGHIKSGHVLYRTILYLLTLLADSVIQNPIVTTPLILALNDWSRRAELTADRAALLTMQDPKKVYTTLARIASGGDHKGLDVQEAIRQADEYDSYGSVLDSVSKLMNLIPQSHPMLLIRIRELKAWVESGKYQKILDGEYVKTGEPGDPGKDFEEAVKSFEDEMARSKDPGTVFVKNIWDSAKQAGKDAENFFKSLFPGGGQ